MSTRPIGPVHHIHSGHVARTYGNVGAILGARLAQAHQVGGIVREIGVHLEDVFIVHFEGAAEARYVSRPQAQLSFALYNMDAARKFGHLALHYVGGPVGRIVVDHKHVESHRKVHHGVDYGGRVLFLVIHRNDYERVGALRAEGSCRCG